MENIYQPFKVKIDKIEKHSSNVKLFRLTGDFSKNKDGTIFMPGQFVLVSHFGYGEAPFGIASSPFQDSYIDFLINQGGDLNE